VQSGATTNNMNYFFSDPANMAVEINGAALSLVSVTASAGVGTAASPFLIRTENELRMVGLGTANPAGYTGWTLAAHYRLDRNITLGPREWVPIGNETAFSGSFNGNGKTISNMTINQPTASYQGMFGRISGNAVIEKLGLINVDVRGEFGAAALVGVSQSVSTTIVQNCFVTGRVSGGRSGSATGTPAAIVAESRGAVSNCVSLLESITSVGSNLPNRVVSNSGGTMSNNYAFAGMTVNNSAVSSSNAASSHGADITAANIAQVQTMLNTTFGVNAPNLNNFLPTVQATSIEIDFELNSDENDDSEQNDTGAGIAGLLASIPVVLPAQTIIITKIRRKYRYDKFKVKYRRGNFYIGKQDK